MRKRSGKEAVIIGAEPKNARASSEYLRQLAMAFNIIWGKQCDISDNLNQIALFIDQQEEKAESQ